jgi:hypothetical protein
VWHALQTTGTVQRIAVVQRLEILLEAVVVTQGVIRNVLTRIVGNMRGAAGEKSARDLRERDRVECGKLPADGARITRAT